MHTAGNNRKRHRIAAIIAAAALLIPITACSMPSDGTASDGQTQTFTPADGNSDTTLDILSGSENKEAAAAIQTAVDESNVEVTLHYMGSLDIMGILGDGADGYDAVWPASSMWISMGDMKHLVKDTESTSVTPVVFGVRQSKAQELGWMDGTDGTAAVPIHDILQAVKDGKLRFSMTSATQSNSGASAYLAFLTTLSGKEGPLTAGDLDNPQLQEDMKTLLSGVDRSSGSSDWLKDMIVQNPDRFDAMVNYESLVIQTDRQLEQDGKEPLTVIYPQEGLAVSDSPLGYIDRGQDEEQAFLDFQKALTSDKAKLDMEQVGRRTGAGGTLTHADDKQVQEAFRTEWGVTTDPSVLRSITLPDATVIDKALTLYQTELRKPSWTVWVVDYSGSMYGDGYDGVVEGLNAALDPKQAAKSRIQPSAGDVNILIPFSSNPDTPVKAEGDDTDSLLDAAESHDTSGGTDMYAALDKALDNLPDDPDDYTTAIVVMTDGQSETFNRDGFEDDYRRRGGNIPIFPIMFGDADPSQLDDLAELSDAKTFDGRDGNLADVFRQVKGYN